jgi:hypothetical protein
MAFREPEDVPPLHEFGLDERRAGRFQPPAHLVFIHVGESRFVFDIDGHIKLRLADSGIVVHE